MPGAMVHGLVWGHHDLRNVHAQDYSLNYPDEEEVVSGGPQEVSMLEEAAALEAKLSEASGRAAAASASAVTPTLSKRQSSVVSMMSVRADGGAAAPPSTGTYLSSTMIYITSCFGCSCLAMPWAYAQSGWALAVGLMFAIAVITQIGANILLECAIRVAGDPSGGVSIMQIAAVASPRLTALPEITVIINCWGSGIGVLVIAAFVLPRSFRDLSSLQQHRDQPPADLRVWDEITKERVLWISVILACTLPLCFLRDITPLKAAGVVSMLAVSFLAAIIAVGYALPAQLHTCELYGEALTCAANVVPVAGSVKDVFSAIPVFFFNYSSNYQLMTVHNSLAKKSTRTTRLAIASSLGFTSVAYVVIGLCSYFTFGTNTQANILGNYGNALAVDLCRLAVIVSVSMLFPLTVYTSRVSIMSMLGKDRIKRWGPKRVFVLVTIAILLLNWLVAVSVSAINVILGVAGALSTVPIALLLPGQYLIKLAAPGDAGRLDRLKGRIAMWSGVVLTGICLYGSLAVGS